MSLRRFKAASVAMVRIGGIPYVLDVENRRLRNVLNGDVIELDELDGP